MDVSEQRVAVLEDDKVAEAYIERPERRSIAGNIYKGTVDNVLPGMEAAFIEIGLEKNGFLYVDEVIAPELEGKSRGRKIQDLLSRGQEVMVQAVKDPMKSKGARLTTEISLPGRFVVFVPHGEGLGVSRRLEDDERVRLRDILKRLDVKKGGVIIRTAAEGASAEDIERDLVFLQRLWKTIETQAKAAKAPSLVYQEAELPLRVIRDLFTEDFERALVDHERTYKRVVGYLKKTSPHMADRVIRYREKTPLMESSGVDAEIRSTLSRRVDLPSGGYLVFDYAEAFTVIDVNTGRFVGGRGKSSGGRLEDTITKNNLEAVKEVVRQLRLRDIGGIIVIDFIDMANPKNRATVEEALKTELERDRTKTYVVEISPLGLVEMTRQNVTDGPREILTRKCTVCGGDGVVLSEASAAVDVERHLRALAASAPRTKAFKVELNAKVASMLVGPGASRLMTIEDETRRRFLLGLPRGRSGQPLRGARQGDAREPGRPGRARRAGGQAGRAEARRGRPPRRQRRRGQARRRLDGHRRQRGGDGRQEGQGSDRARARRRRLRVARRRQEGARGADHGRERGREADAQAACEEAGRRGGGAKSRKREPERGRGPEEERDRRGRAGRRGGRDPRRPAAEEEDPPRLTRWPPAQEEAGDRGPGERRRSSRAAERRERRGPEDPSARSHARPRGGARGGGDPVPNGEGEGEQPKPKKKTRRGSRGGRRRRKPAAAQGGSGFVRITRFSARLGASAGGQPAF